MPVATVRLPISDVLIALSSHYSVAKVVQILPSPGVNVFVPAFPLHASPSGSLLHL